jgi:hypothetical protein
LVLKKEMPRATVFKEDDANPSNPKSFDNTNINSFVGGSAKKRPEHEHVKSNSTYGEA